MKPVLKDLGKSPLFLGGGGDVDMPRKGRKGWWISIGCIFSAEEWLSKSMVLWGQVTKLGDARVDGDGLCGCRVVVRSSPGGAWVVPVLLEIAGEPFAGIGIGIFR